MSEAQEILKVFSDKNASVSNEDFEGRQPMERLGTAQEIADFAIYLASDESTFTTGNIFSVDGGMTI